MSKPNIDPHNAVSVMNSQIVATMPSADILGFGEFFNGSHRLIKTKTATATNASAGAPIPNREDNRVLNLDIDLYRQDAERCA
jgi:hypothetical protein